MENSMSTVFKFVFESAGGGSTPENVSAQTGDWLAILLVALFALAAIASLVFASVKTKNSGSFAHTASHAAVKTATNSKTIVAFIIAALAIVGICISVANAPALRAFANGNAEGVDYKPQITATVHEDTQTVTFEQNYFTNLEASPIHIDHSSLTLSEEAQSLLGDFELRLQAQYSDGTTYVFNDKAGAALAYLPYDQYELAQNNSQDIVYSSNLTYEMAQKLCEAEEAFTLEMNPAQCVTVTYDKGEGTTGEPPHSQTVSKSSEPDVIQTITKAPGRGSLAKSGYTFANWNTKQDGTGTAYKEGDPVDPADTALTLYPQWENTSGFQIVFNNDGKGKAALKGQTPPQTDLEVTLPLNTTYSASDTGEITFTKPDNTTVIVVPYADRYISYTKWERDGSDVTTGKIEDDKPFKVNFDYDTFTITYRGMYEGSPHGTMKPNTGGDAVVSYTEEFQPANPQNAQLPKGVTAIEDPTKDYDAFFYYFVNWTDEDGNPVSTGTDPKNIVPTQPSTGWADATYIVHFATPKAVYSENGQTGEKLLKFYYDEDPHAEASKKYYVKNSKFEFSDEGKITSVDAPNWFTPTVINQTTGKIVSYSTPLIYPTKVEIDPGFKNYKHLESTDMWFMDGAVIPILEQLSPGNSSSPQGSSLMKARQIESIVGLENINTENIRSTSLMFAAGVPALSMLGEFLPYEVPETIDTLESIDLSSWTNMPKLDGQMTAMFGGCNALADLKLPLESTSNFGEKASDAIAMFLACKSLPSLTINNGFCSSAKSLRMMFQGCTSLVEFKQGALSSFGERANVDLYSMFQGCSKLSVADISTVSSDYLNCSNLFSNCGNLVDLRLPNGWRDESWVMGLDDPNRQWYKYNGETYEPITEDNIGPAGGGTFTRMAPKAIYNASQSTLTFYYDYLTHGDEGEPFLINNSMPSLDSTISSVFPSWYDVDIFVDNKEVQYIKDLADADTMRGANVSSNINLKAPAKTVIFDSSFATLKDSEKPLNLIFGWFMGDNNPAHSDSFTTFKSTGTNLPPFYNFPTESVSIWACPFGGFSMEVLCSTFNAMSKGLDPNIIFTYFSILGSNGEEDNFYTGADTFSSRTSLDLSSLKTSVNWIALGLVANSPKLTNITLPNNSLGGIFSWAFMNCSALNSINGGYMSNTWKPSSIYKMFYGCSELTSVDFSKLDFNSSVLANSRKQYFTFKNCNKLKTLTLGDSWGNDKEHLTTMEDCSLPGDVWKNQDLADEDLSPREIPIHNGNKITGTFVRTENQAKEVSFKVVDEQGGTISPDPGKLNIYGDTNFACDGNSIILGDTKVTAIPNTGYAVKSWKLNGEKVKNTGYGDNFNVISYDTANKFEFTVSFIGDNLSPKAVYNSAEKTLSFYYDTESHTGDGLEVFDVYNNTYMDINVDTGQVSAKLPAWYDYTISKKFQWDSPDSFEFNPQLKIDATKVIFTKSFKDYDDLESISMWFMADRSGKQPFKEFYSEGENGSLTEGFSNINTISLENVAFAFGGFSVFPSIVTSNDAKAKFFNNFTQDPNMIAQLKAIADNLSNLDTYGTSLQDIDISTFDTEHNVSNFAAMFCNCTALYSIELGANIAGANITNMDAMFQNCESLGMKPGSTEIIGNLNKLNTSNVTSMNLLFFGDCGIKSLDLSNFNTLKTLDSNSSGKQTWNTLLMFWDCTRINSIKLNTIAEPNFSGWTVPLEKCYLLDNNDPDSIKEPKINVWTNDKYPETVWNSTLTIPFDGQYYPPKPEMVYTGTFERKALTESKTTFTTNNKDYGLVNGQESVVYSYIQTDNVRLDANKPSDMLSDNFRITPEANETYKFDHWETGAGFEEQGKVVTLQDKWLFDAGKGQATERTLVAVFESKDLCAKAVYEKPAEANGEGNLTFYYDDEAHTGDNVVVFDVNPNTSVYDLPEWYDVSDIPPWVESDDRPIPYFNSEIDNGANRPSKIVVTFDKSFSQYKQLTSLSCWFMPAIDRSDSTKLYSPFQFDSTSFKQVEYINTASVYNLWYMFGGHENANDYAGSHITAIDLSGFDQANNLKNINGMFANCCDLTSLTLPSNFGQNCTSMSHTFFNCRALTGDYLNTALSPMNTKGVTDMSYMFASYKDSTGKTPIAQTTTLKFPKSFNTSNVESFEGMFAGYTNTQKLIITDDTLGTVGEPHKGCANWDYLFANNHSLTSSLQSIEWTSLSWFNTQDYAKSMKGMFMNNTSMTNLDFIAANESQEVVHFDTSSVEDMSYMFSGCTSLANIDIVRPTNNVFSTAKVTNMSYMFEKTALAAIDFSSQSLNTQVLENANRMFSGCPNLASVKLDRSQYGDIHSAVLSAMYMFENCPLLQSIDLSSFYVSSELIPEDETGVDTSSMVNSVYNMFANTAADGNVTKNSTITEFTIAEDWVLPMEVTGLATLNSLAQPVLWYNKADVFVAGFPSSDVPPANPSKQIDGSYTKYGTYSNKEPLNFTVSTNNKLWGSVTNLASGMYPQYEFSKFMDSVKLSVVNGATYGEKLPVLHVQFNNFEQALPFVANANESTFVGWKVYKKGSETPVSIDVNQQVEFNTDIEIQAVFENGPVPIYAYIPQEDEGMLMFECYRKDVAEAAIPQLEAMGGKGDFLPEDGDFGEEGIPWAEFADKITEVEISESFEFYSGFTTFKEWFKGLSKVEGINGIYYLDSTNVTDFSGMFQGCSNIKEMILGIDPAGSDDGPSIRVNENAVNTSNMFKGCSSLKTLAFNGFRNIETGTDMFSGCTSLNNIMLDEKLNKKLHTDLGLPESNWYYSGQKSLNAYTADNIQDNMHIAKSLDFLVGECVLARVTDSATLAPNKVENGQITDQLGSGQYYDNLTAHFNAEGGISCKAKATSTSLVLTFNDVMEGYELGGLETSWSITINQKVIKDGYIFYQWENNGSEISISAPVTINNNDSIKAIFDVKKSFVAVANEGSLTFYYDGQSHDEEGTVYEVPNQWYTKSGGAETSPFADVASSITSITFDSSVLAYKSLYETWCWFKGFNNLTTINGLENLRIANVTNFGHMFEDCSSIQAIDLSGNDTNIKQATFLKMFNNCKLMTELNISNLQTDGSYILEQHPAANMLVGCTALTKITFGQNWKNATMINCAGDSISTKWVNVEEALSVNYAQFPNTEYAGSGTFEVAKYSATFSVPKAYEGYFTFSLNEIYFSDSLTAKYKIDSTTKFMTIVLQNTTSGTSKEYPISVKRNNYAYKFNCWTLNGEKLSGEASVADGNNFVIDVSDDKNTALAWYDELNWTLHFSYDEQDHSGHKTMNINPGWTQESSQFSGTFPYEDIQFVQFDTSFKSYTDLTSLKGWFNGFRSLLKINGLENVNTQFVEDMSFLFAECYTLCQTTEEGQEKTLDLSSWYTSNVRHMQNMFFGCQTIEYLQFGQNFDTSKVESFANMFSGMNSLKELDISCFKIGTKSKGIPHIEYMISDLSNAKTINVAVSECKYNYLSEGYDYGAQWNFGGCDSMNKIISNGNLCFDLHNYGIKGSWIEPSGGTWWSMLIEQSGTYLKLSTITFKSSDVAGGTLDDNSEISFNADDSYAVITQDPSDNSSIEISLKYLNGQTYATYHRHFSLAEGSTYSFKEWKITPEPSEGKIVSDTQVVAVVEDSNKARAYFDSNTGKLSFFYDDQNHGSNYVDVPKYWGVSGYSDNFQEEWERSPFSAYSEKTKEVFIDSSFASCKGILSLCSWFESFINVTSYSGLSNIDSSNIGIGGSPGCMNMFRNNYKLTTIDVSGLNTAGDPANEIPACGSFMNMFRNCYSLESITLDDGSKTSNFYIQGDCNEMFAQCKKLTNIDFSYITEDRYVGSTINMFRNCYNLQTIDFGHLYVTAGNDCGSMIDRCFALKSIKFDADYFNDNQNIQFMNISPVWGNWYIDNEPIKNWKIDGFIKKATFSRSPEELAKITFQATGEYAENGVVYVDGFRYNEGGAITELVVPKGTIFTSNISQIFATYTDNSDNFIKWQFNINSEDTTMTCKPIWSFTSPYTVTQNDTLSYVLELPSLLLSSPEATDNNVQAENIPQIDPSVPEAEDNTAGAAAALMAAAPALAALGFRRRIRGKHARIK